MEDEEDQEEEGEEKRGKKEEEEIEENIRAHKNARQSVPEIASHFCDNRLMAEL